MAARSQILEQEALRVSWRSCPRLLDSSTEAMLAEHERLSDLYLYNSEMGEKRTYLYLTLISAGGAILTGIE